MAPMRVETDGLLPIGRFAHATGLTVKALRHYAAAPAAAPDLERLPAAPGPPDRARRGRPRSVTRPTAPAAGPG
jgi:hypothetical protein